MKNLMLSLPTVDALIRQLIRDSGFRISYYVRSCAEEPNLRVIFEGPDSELLIRDGGELLEAIRHFIAEALGLDEDERHRIAYSLNDDQADLRWEFHRCYEAAPGLPARSNASCVSDELWEQLVQHPQGMTVLSMN